MMSDDITFCPCLDCEIKSCVRQSEDCPKNIFDVIDKWIRSGEAMHVSAEEIKKALLED